MTSHDIGFFAVIVCVSAVIGVILGLACRGRTAVTIVCGVLASLLLFIILEWRFGAAEEWSWQDPITSSAYLFGPFVILVAAPLIGTALLAGRWLLRRKVI